jgi:hypothetical protein
MEKALRAGPCTATRRPCVAHPPPVIPLLAGEPLDAALFFPSAARVHGRREGDDASLGVRLRGLHGHVGHAPAWPARGPLPSFFFNFSLTSTWTTTWAGPLFKKLRGPRLSRPCEPFEKKMEIAVQLC